MISTRIKALSKVGIGFALSTACMFGAKAQDSGVLYCYLTWQGNPSTTMTVQYQTHGPAEGVSKVHYDTVSRDGEPDSYAHSVEGATHTIPGLASFIGMERTIHTIELTGLEPGETYYFVAGNEHTGYTEEKKFRTIPDGDAPIRFITGGDMGIGPVVRKLLRHAADQDPMFGLIGGDIAYANGNFDEWEDWETWLHDWEELMVTSDGCMIPMVHAIGNHETNDNEDADNPLMQAPFYFGYFAQAGRGVEETRRTYFELEFGDSVTLLILDSGHYAPEDGQQRVWLRNRLMTADDVPFVFAAYHVPLYPSHRDYGEGSASARMRESWGALFDEFRLTAGFENHDHMFKRTHRMRDNKQHPEGVLYLGDGCFGRSPRAGDQARKLDNPAYLRSVGLDASYLAKWAPKYHFWTVETPAKSEADAVPVRFKAIDEDGEVFDEAAIPAHSNPRLEEEPVALAE